MFSVELIGDLFRHMTWADARVWDAIPDWTGTADDRLRAVLLHTHIVQRAFLNVWTGQPVVFPRAGEFPTLAALHAWVQPYYAEARTFIAGIEEKRLADPVWLPWMGQFEDAFGQKPHAPTLGETMFQVTSHSTHHRAQACARLRELGGTAPLVDYIVWVTFGRPAAA